MKIRNALIVGGALLAFSVSAQAASMAFMNHSILSSIPKKDLPSFRAVVADVLNNQPDGASTSWTGSQPRRGGPIKADLTVKRSVETQKASKCRLLDAKISQDADTENWAFWFCQQPSGEWKASHN